MGWCTGMRDKWTSEGADGVRVVTFGYGGDSGSCHIASGGSVPQARRDIACPAWKARKADSLAGMTERKARTKARANADPSPSFHSGSGNSLAFICPGFTPRPPFQCADGFLRPARKTYFFLRKPSSSSQSANRSIQWSVGMFCLRMPKPCPPLAYKCSSADLCASVHSL